MTVLTLALISLCPMAAGAPTPPCDAAVPGVLEDLRAASQAVSQAVGEVDRPGEAATVGVSFGGDLKPGAEVFNGNLTYGGEAAISWSMDDDGRLHVSAVEGGEAGVGGDLGWTVDGAVGAGVGLGAELIFDDAAQAAAWLDGVMVGDAEAAAANRPGAAVSAEVLRSVAAEAALGGVGVNPAEVALRGRLEHVRSYQLIADDGSIQRPRTDSVQGGLSLSLPLRGEMIAGGYRYRRSEDVSSGAGGIQHSLDLALPAGTLKSILDAEGREGLASALRGALAEAEELPAELIDADLIEDAAAALAHGVATGTLQASVGLRVTWTWGIDATGESTYRHRRIYLSENTRLGGEVEARAAEVHGSVTTERRELVHEQFGSGPPNE